MAYVTFCLKAPEALRGPGFGGAQVRALEGPRSPGMGEGDSEATDGKGRLSRDWTGLRLMPNLCPT